MLRISVASMLLMKLFAKTLSVPFVIQHFFSQFLYVWTWSSVILDNCCSLWLPTVCCVYPGTSASCYHHFSLLLFAAVSPCFCGALQINYAHSAIALLNLDKKCFVCILCCLHIHSFALLQQSWSPFAACSVS